MGMKDIRRLLERLATGCRRRTRANVSSSDTSGARTVAWSLALGPGLDSIGGSRGVRTRGPHHRHVGRRLKRQGSHSPGLRAVGWFPPALDGDQQAQLKAAVQALPEKAGIDLANWNWKVVRRFVQERFGLSLSRQQLPELLASVGFCPEAAEETFSEGRRW